MKRNEFLAVSALAAAAGMGRNAVAGGKDARVRPEYYELRLYHMHVGDKKKVLNSFVRDAEIPALNRLGIEPVGVFTSRYGADSLTLYMLIPYTSLESFSTVADRLAEDNEYQQAGGELLDAPISDPAYARIESSLMVGFDRMPKLEVPKQSRSRIFELRTYESHSRKAGSKKIEMFNTAEIDIFLKTGLKPVFFGQTVIGRQLPNLTYMLCFEDMTARDKTWDVFRADPEWKELRARPEFADTVSNISVKILRPAPYSQI